MNTSKIDLQHNVVFLQVTLFIVMNQSIAQTKSYAEKTTEDVFIPVSFTLQLIFFFFFGNTKFICTYSFIKYLLHVPGTTQQYPIVVASLFSEPIRYRRKLSITGCLSIKICQNVCQENKIGGLFTNHTSCLNTPDLF